MEDKHGVHQEQKQSENEIKETAQYFGLIPVAAAAYSFFKNAGELWYEKAAVMAAIYIGFAILFVFGRAFYKGPIKVKNKYLRIILTTARTVLWFVVSVFVVEVIRGSLF